MPYLSQLFIFCDKLKHETSNGKQPVPICRKYDAKRLYYCSQCRQHYKAQSLPLLLKNFQKNLLERYKNIPKKC